MPDGPAADLVDSLVGLPRTMTDAGVPIGPDRTLAFLQAVDRLDVHDRADVYWAGRLTLCTDPDEIAVWDLVHDEYLRGTTPRSGRRTPIQMRVQQPSMSPGLSPPEEGEATTEVHAIVANASDTERLRHMDVSRLTDEQRRQVNAMIAALSLQGGGRRTRRHRPARRGSIDRQRTVRRMLAGGGEPTSLARRRRIVRPRPVVLLADISGSMAAYSDVLLRFAHAAVRRPAGRVEVFTVGTRLTRVTRPLSHRDPDRAMRAVADEVPDSHGGTRLGPLVREFLDRWGQPGMARGAVVVVLSDGWERGDVEELGEQMARMSRLAHRVIWCNPRMARTGFAPIAGGMAAALPYCDDLVPGHSLAAFEQLAASIAESTARPYVGRLNAEMTDA